MDSFFFIPADDSYKLQKSTTLTADHIIADLEDAVSHHNYNEAVKNLLGAADLRIDYLRVDPDQLQKDYLCEKIFGKYQKIIFPKICNEESLSRFLDFHNTYNLEYILLVEHPWLLLNVHRLLMIKDCKIKMIAFGNHDYAKAMDIDIYSEAIKFARIQCAQTACAYNVTAIDVASMELEDEKKFKEECKEGFEMGYAGKFIIHPRQLKWLDEVGYYSSEKIQWAKDVIRLLENDGEEKALNTLDGRVIEKPHLQQAKEILKRAKL